MRSVWGLLNQMVKLLTPYLNTTIYAWKMFNPWIICWGKQITKQISPAKVTGSGLFCFVLIFPPSNPKAKTRPHRIFRLIYSNSLIDVSQQAGLIYMATENVMAEFFILTNKPAEQMVYLSPSSQLGVLHLPLPCWWSDDESSSNNEVVKSCICFIIDLLNLETVHHRGTLGSIQVITLWNHYICHYFSSTLCCDF